MTRPLILRSTGEVLDLDTMATDDLAARVDEIRELRDRLADADREISDELLARMDRRGEWTAEVGDWRVQGSSPETAIDYDPDALEQALGALQGAGLIDADAAADAFRVTVTRRPSKSRINRLLKLGGEVAERIAATRIEGSRPRRVKVTRRPSTLDARRARALPPEGGPE